ATLALSVLFTLTAHAQTPTDSLHLLDTLPIQATFATADNLGNIYVITTQNAVEKYSPDGTFQFRYSNNRLGAATALDATNPLKVLVWYADFRTVVFLNRSLTALGELNLIQAGYPEVRTVASAADGNLWLYDEVAFQLKKVTPEGQTKFESQALNLIQSKRIAINCIRDKGAEVLASDAELGVLRFDVYAQFQQVLPWKGIARFALRRNMLAYQGAAAVHIEQLQVPASRSLPLPDSVRQTGGTSWIAPGLLLVQNGEILELWQWQ
ncbi:MAG: hypothetical protein H6569_14625, partial [Lewinellaceae bacterium]|nr:hypothetical protein [Lewinellaceae bacterium]